MGRDDHLEDMAHLAQLVGVEPALRVEGGVSGRVQEHIALAQWHVERPCELDDHRAARARPA